MTTARQGSQSGRLVRLGFVDPDRALTLLGDRALDGLPPELLDPAGGSIPAGLGECPDPDQALLALVRVRERLVRDWPDEARALDAALAGPNPLRDKLFAVLGASAALGDHLARHPRHWHALGEDAAAPDLRAVLLTAVGADPAAADPAATSADPLDDLRIAYYRCLLSLAGRDLVAPDPVTDVPLVARELADLAAAALEAGLAIARAELPAGSQPCRIAVIGMGKCGGRELNYVSDVDVVYVVEPVEGGDESAALATGAKLAAGLARACSAPTPEGVLWPVDANLRPEGRQGPLVRTLASHRAYYERWAQTWEFQALLKARTVAGDAELGAAYLAMVDPLVWAASQRENFVEDVQAMRRRVEDEARTSGRKDADRQLKLGAGGLRDVEFAVQLLQLVHGRVDPRLRTGNTWLGLEALSTYGYVGRGDAADMDRAYRMLRALEHRIQLQRLHRSRVVPTSETELRRLGRSFGFRTTPGEQLLALWRRNKLEARRLHEKLFYRPLLGAAAALTTDEARLTPEAATVRLKALGYHDPAGALRHLSALADGVSRRAAIQRQLLPVMLAWFADGADPDAGLLAFRRLSEALGSTHWYLKILRDSGSAAERLAHVLSSSQMLADLLEKGPEAVAMLETDQALAPLELAAMLDLVHRGASRYTDDPFGAAMSARAIRRREIVRAGVADVVGLADLETVGVMLSDAAAAALEGALAAASTGVAQKFGGTLPTRLAVIAMGRLGGREINYGSDADVLFVHDPLPGADSGDASRAALEVVTELRRLLALTGPEPVLLVDPDLRPEGRQGALVRSLAAYAEYYRRWSVSWETQALTRARPVAGDLDLGAAFVDLIDPVRWHAGGLDDDGLREIRRIKARVEAERLPRGADPHRHVKLGRGGLADVEWTVQLIQLQHAFEVPALRVTGTLPALAAARDAGQLAAADAEVLETAWRLASRIRNAVALWRGRPNDVPPTNYRDLDGVARLAGYPPASAWKLEEDYQRATRRCRTVVERLFYG